MPKRRLFFALFIVLLIAYVAYQSNIQRYAVPLSAFDDPIVTSYGDFDVAALPWGKTSSCLVTIDDVSYHTSTSDLFLLVNRFEELGVHATFFVIPAHGNEEKSVANNPALLSALQTAQYFGCEIAQHGYTHTPAAELKGLSYAEQLEAITRGKEILDSCFGSVTGFRPPSFWANTDTYRVLVEQGFEYCGSASVFNVYPYYPPGHVYPVLGTPLDILIIPTFPEDNLWEISSDEIGLVLYNLNARWTSCQERGTPYVLTTHLSPLMSKEGFDVPGFEALSTFLTSINDGSVWFPSMDEYRCWIETRKSIEIGNIINNERLIIDISSEKSISGLTITLHDLDDVNDVIVTVNGVGVYNAPYTSSNQIVIS